MRARSLCAAAWAACLLVPIAVAAPEGFTSTDSAGFASRHDDVATISHRFLGEPALGQSLEVVIEVTALTDIDDLTMHFTSDDELILIAPLTQISLGTLARGSSREVSVTVLPLAAQRLHLNVAMRADAGGTLRGRALAIPVLLGTTKADRSGIDRKSTSDGENLSSFRAEETVH